MADRGVNVVFFQRSIEGSGEGGIEYCGSQGEAHDEEATDGRHNRCRKTTPAAEEGEKADKNLDNGGDDGNDVGDKHPFGHLSVSFEASCEFLAEELIRSCLIEAPYVDRVEPKFICMLGAERDVVVGIVFRGRVVVVEVTGAVVPQTNVVEIIDAGGVCSR